MRNIVLTISKFELIIALRTSFALRVLDSVAPFLNEFSNIPSIKLSLSTNKKIVIIKSKKKSKDNINE